jgi:hypothetical protein
VIHRSSGALSMRVLGAAALLVLLPSRANAYGWMIQHGYTSCGVCHADPSGGTGPLTPYGRAQGEILLQSTYGKPPGEEAGPATGFLWGVLKTPEWLLAGGGVRLMPIAMKIGGGATQTDLIVMQADLAAEIHAGQFRAGGSVGGITTDQSPASLSGKLISREHWAGWSFGDDTWLLRAGRINMPFGVRTLDHTVWVRASTRTDLNETQQHGIALAYTGKLLRGEVMAIAGDFQIPSQEWEHGYSGYLELMPASWLALGVSSLVTNASQDIITLQPTTRQAHGVFARVAPWGTLVLTGEADFIVNPSGQTDAHGLATMVQADLEVLRGVHLMAIGETQDIAGRGGLSVGGWLGAGWFFASHTDIRVDLMQRTEAFGNQRVAEQAAMLQAHLYF